MRSMVIHRWSYVGRLRKMSSRPGTESIQVFTWNFHPGMKFQPGAERTGMNSSRDEQISPRFHVNTKRQITRHRGEIHPGMKLAPG